LKLTLTLQEWSDIFDIDGVEIVDELGWNPYCLNEGTANYNTQATLSIVQVSRMSPLSDTKIEALFKKLA